MGSSYCFLTSAPGEWARTCGTSMLKDPGLQGREINLPFLLHKVYHWVSIHQEEGCLPSSCCMASPGARAHLRAAFRHIFGLAARCAPGRGDRPVPWLCPTPRSHFISGSGFPGKCNYQCVRLEQQKLAATPGCVAACAGREAGGCSDFSPSRQPAIKWWLWNSGRRGLVIFGALLVNVSRSCLPSHRSASRAW